LYGPPPRIASARLSVAAIRSPGEGALVDKLLYRVTEAGECLGVSRSKVYLLIRSGALPSVRIGGARRIRASDLQGYVDSLREAMREPA
jgi:excisionase family DNA binding protein